MAKLIAQYQPALKSSTKAQTQSYKIKLTVDVYKYLATLSVQLPFFNL